jgi:hypothetical protein
LGLDEYRVFTDKRPLVKVNAILTLALLAAVVTTGLQAAPPLAQSGALAKGVGLSLHGKDPSKPAATVMIDEVKLGAQRRGFFRVAALPLIVGEGVAFRFRMADASALADLPATFETIAHADTLELRRVAWFAPGEEKPLLRAEMAEVDGTEAWRLTNVEWADGTRSASATLAIEGKHAGLVSWTSDDGTQRRPLFSDHP